MRIGANLVLIEGLTHQSHNWNFYRPIGPLQDALDALSRYEVDEINVISLDYKKIDGLHLSVEKLLECNCTTPLTFGGGINIQNIDMVLKNLPAERYSFCSSLISNELSPVKKVISILGFQAVVGCMPIRIVDEKIEIFFPKEAKFVELSEDIIETFIVNCDEIIVYDTEADGQKTGFNFDIFKKLQIEPSQTIISGGIVQKDIKHATSLGISAVHIDNSSLHFENGGAFR